MIFEILKDETPIIKVIGVGGGGSNAVNHMYNQGIVGVDFAITNTDSQALEISPVQTKMLLGPNQTEGRGAGSKPNIGKLACEESLEDIRRFLENDCKMLFVTAGMGGGTGTGAAPIIAKKAQEMDILTVGIVTMPFTFEGRRREQQAMDGLEELKKNVDTLIVINNDKLRQIHGNLSLTGAFAEADEILAVAAKGIAEIITVPGYVNVDFEDVNTVMRDSGVAIMGTAMAEGENRAKRAVDEAMNSPLLEDNSIKGAQHILLNITSGTNEVTMDEIFEITEFVQEEAGHGTDLIWGNCYNESLGESISVTIIATGFDKATPKLQDESTETVRIHLDDESLPNPSLEEVVNEEEIFTTSDAGTTVEFENLNEDISKINRNRYVDEPESDFAKMQAQKERQRRERLRNAQTKLNSPRVINELEQKPAYLRRDIQLDNIQPSSEPTASRWTIENEGEVDPEGNSFLHDNVD